MVVLQCAFLVRLHYIPQNLFAFMFPVMVGHQRNSCGEAAILQLVPIVTYVLAHLPHVRQQAEWPQFHPPSQGPMSASQTSGASVWV